MSDEIVYSFETRVGTFYISFQQGWWHAVFERESLGRFYYPHHASEALASGETDSLPSGLNPGSLGIPPDLGDWEWERIR